MPAGNLLSAGRLPTLWKGMMLLIIFTPAFQKLERLRAFVELVMQRNSVILPSFETRPDSRTMLIDFFWWTT